MEGYAGDMLRVLCDICESKRGIINDDRVPHPNIIKLYDEIEDLLYDFVMCVYKEWTKRKDAYEEEEARAICRDIVGDIGKLWIHSPYFNKDHPLYVKEE